MRYNELTDNNQNILDKIESDCKPFLSMIDGDYENFGLYRGISSNKPFGIKTARLKNRRPKDTATKEHVSMNRYFDKRFGHPYRNGFLLRVILVRH